MTTYRIKAPDGNTYSIDGPAGASDEQVREQVLKQHPGADKAAGPSVTADVAKSAGVGLGKGLINFAGTAGDASNLLAKGSKAAGDYVGGLMGFEPSPDLHAPVLPTSGGIQKGIESKTGEFYQPQTTAGKYAGSVGEVLGNPASYLGPGGPAAKVLTGAASGLGSEAAGELAQGMGASPGVETAARLAGAVVGGKAPAGAARMVSPIPTTAERQADVDILAREGVNAQTAGQTTGSKALQTSENYLGDSPFAGGKATASRDAVGRQFTAAALRRAGIQGEDLAKPQVIDGAFQRIGGEMDAIAGRNNARQDQQFVQDLLVARGEYEQTVQAGSRRAVVDRVIEDFNERMAQSPIITGEQYQRFRSRLTRLQRGAANDPEYSEVLGAYVEALDGMMERSIQNSLPSGPVTTVTINGRATTLINGRPAPPNWNDLQNWREARRQYRNLIPLARASTGGGEQAAEGIITPARLKQAITSGRRGERDYARGRGDFAELTRAGNVVLTPLPNSGTAQRELAHIVPAAMGGAAGLLLGGAPEAAGAAILGAATPALAGRAIMSPLAQGYLANQVAAGLPQALPSPAIRSAVTSPLAPQSALAPGQ